MNERHRLRMTFNEAPELYDLARPTYPVELFDDLVALARLAPGARLLEIGCGTGQATLPLAERGFEIVCVELGGGMAALARKKLAGFPNVEIVTASFESWEPSEGAFDAIVSFTAFHWIDPELRYEKTARLLREGGALAVVGTRHVLPEDGDSFFSDVQEDYDAVAPSDENRPPPLPAEVADHLRAEIESSGCFDNVKARRHLWDVSYTADEYIRVLSTYSGHRVLDPETQRDLFERIHRRIDARLERRARKTYLATLVVAERTGALI